MKKLISIITGLFLAMSSFGQSTVKWNSLTTNSDPVALGIITNISGGYATNGTNYALLIGQNGTNYTLLVGLNVTNLITVTSNGLYALLPSGGAVTPSQATNIALYQANLVGANDTNFALAIGANGTNYANSLVLVGPTNGIPTLGGKGTNNVLFSPTNYTMTVAATNIVIGSRLATAANGTNVISITGGTFDANNPGDYIIVTNATGTSQMQIIRKLDSTHVRVYPKVGQYNPAGFTNTTFQVFPNAVWIPDNSGVNPAGWIGNDGSIGIIGQGGLGTTSDNTGYLIFANDVNSVAQTVYQNIGPNNQALWAWGVTGVTNWSPVFFVSTKATYGVGGIRDDNHIDWAYPFTNSSGNVFQINTGLKIYGSTSNNATFTIYGTNVITPSATVSGTNGMAILVGSAGAFSGLFPGCKIGINSGGYNEYTIVSNSTTVAYTLEQLQNTYASVAFTAQFPNMVWNNQTPAQAGSIGPDGSIMVQSTSVGSSPKIAFNNGMSTSNSVYFQVNSESGVPYLEVKSGGGAPSVLIAAAAPINSVVVRPSGFLEAKLTYPTNLQTTVVDMTQRFSDVTTNATFAWVGYTGIGTTNYQFCTVFLTNSSGSLINFTAPANTHTNGTFNATNVTKVEFTINANRWTNAIATPLW